MNKHSKRIFTLLLIIATMVAFSIPTFAASALKVSKTKVSIYAGDKYTVTAKYNGKKVTPKWTTNKKAVATVNKKGVISGKKAGTAVITATYKGKKSKITVKVVAPKQSITVSGRTVKLKNNTMTLIQGKKGNLVTTLKTKRSKVTTTTLKPTQVKWKTSNKNIVTVNNKGVVVAKKVGTAYITATYKNLKFKFKIVVKKKPSSPTTPTTPSPASSSGHWEEQVTGYQYVCQCGACFPDSGSLVDHQVNAELNGESNHVAHDTIPVTERVWVED